MVRELAAFLGDGVGGEGVVQDLGCGSDQVEVQVLGISWRNISANRWELDIKAPGAAYLAVALEHITKYKLYYSSS